jgi:hypothetical protein
MGVNDLRGFETIHFRHVDIEQNGGELMMQYMPQGSSTGLRSHYVKSIFFRCVG